MAGLSFAAMAATTIAVLSQKGGTGKTTLVRTLSDVFGRLGLSVLAVDADPQGNLSDYFDTPQDAAPTLADVLMGEARAVDAIHDGVIPANLQLAEAELALAGKIGREVTLRNALREVKRTHDVILIDCPPTLGLLTVNALVAAHGVIIPLACEYFAMRGVALLVDTIAKVQDRLNPKLTMDAIVPTMYDARTLHSQEVVDRVREAFGDRVTETMIGRTVKFPDATVAAEPILTHAPQHAGSLAYRQLARELIARSIAA